MMLRKRLIVAVASGILIGGISYVTLEKVSLTTTGNRALTSRVAPLFHLPVLQELTDQSPDAPFPEAYKKLMDELSPYESRLMSSELAKPGDYLIETTDIGWRLTIIDWPYLPVTIPISADGTPVLADS